MAQPDTASDNRSMLERHLQTGIQLLLVGLIGWSGLKLVALGEHIAVLQERQLNQGRQIENLRRDLRDWSNLYYRKTDASREIGSLKGDVHRLGERVTELEDNRP